MLDTAKRNSCQRGEIEISYLEWNDAKSLAIIDSEKINKTKKPLLLLHGLADCGVIWSSLGEHLADQYHIVAPDLRGHGESSKPESGYSSEDIIADLETLMTHLGWKQAHILGHSWGGKLATIWASKNSQRFASLTLVDPFYVDKLPRWLKITFPFLYRVLPFLQGMGPFSSKAAAIETAQNLKQYRQWTSRQQQAFLAGIELKQDGTWGSKFTISARNQIFTDVMQKSGLSEPLDIPSLFIQPTEGLNRTKWQLKPFYLYLSDLEVQQLSGNHWIFLVNPAEFNQKISTYLAKQEN